MTTQTLAAADLRQQSVIDIAVVVLVSAFAWFLEDWLRRSAVVTLADDSRGVLAVVAGGLTAVTVHFLRGGNLADLGFRRPARWRTVPFWIVGILTAYVVAQAVVPVVVGQVFEFPQPDLSRYSEYHGNAGAVIALVLILPFTASIPEEVIYRGFVMGRLATIFGTSFGGQVITVVVQAALFGSVHFQWGIGGMIVTAIMGAVWGTAFLLCGRNLWIMILTHSTGHVLLAAQLYMTPAAS